MSDFAERIRDARLSTRTLAVAPIPTFEPPPRLRGVGSDDPPPEPRPAPVIDLLPGPSPEELEARRRRIDELAHKIDELNATLLQELVRVPGAASEYPRTVAALAGELVDRAQRAALPQEAR